VNPWGFAKHFNDRVEFDPAFHDLFKGRRLLAEGKIVEKAQTQPMPDAVPFEEKSPRVVALQLIKRARDVAYRASNRKQQGLRKAPAIVLNAIALEAGPVHASLLDEIVAIAGRIRARLTETNGPRGTLQVFNPAYPADEFTDRWPENKAAQDLFEGDLRRLTVGLYKLRNEAPSLEQKRDLLKELFGETPATYAIESNLNVRRHEMEAGRLHVGSHGKVIGATTAALAGTSSSTAARPATREGGEPLPE